jgi:hypothetical protein
VNQNLKEDSKKSVYRCELVHVECTGVVEVVHVSMRTGMFLRTEGFVEAILCVAK